MSQRSNDSLNSFELQNSFEDPMFISVEKNNSPRVKKTRRVGNLSTESLEKVKLRNKNWMMKSVSNIGEN